MWQWSSRAISLTCHIMHSEIKPKACIVGVSFVNSVKEWYLVHLMSARGERYLYPDLLIYSTGFVDCPFLLRMWSLLKSKNFFLDAFDKPYLKYHETQISASIPVYALSKFEKKSVFKRLGIFLLRKTLENNYLFFSCWISSINWSIFRHSLNEIPGKQFFRVSVQGPRCLKECYVFDQLEVYWTVANKTFF